MTSLIVSVHDVAPATSELSRRWLDNLETMGVKASLLVVPGFWKSRHLHDNQNFIDWLHAAELNGHEIVQHGLHHERMQKAVNPQAINTSVGRRRPACISGRTAHRCRSAGTGLPCRTCAPRRPRSALRADRLPCRAE